MANIMVQSSSSRISDLQRLPRLVLAMIRNDEETFVAVLAHFSDYDYKNRVAKSNAGLLPERIHYEYNGKDLEDDCWFSLIEFACFLGRSNMVYPLKIKGDFRKKNTSSSVPWWCRCADSASINCLKVAEKRLTSVRMPYVLPGVLRRACVVPYRPELEAFVDYIVGKIDINTRLYEHRSLGRERDNLRTESCLLLSSKHQKSVKMAKFQLSRGADVHVANADHRGKTAYDYAVDSGDKELVAVVREAGGKAGSYFRGFMASLTAKTDMICRNLT